MKNPYESPLKKVLLSHFYKSNPAKSPKFDARFWRIFVEKGLIFQDIDIKLAFYFFSKRSERGNRAFSSFSCQSSHFWLFHSWPKEKHPFFVFFKLPSEVRAARRTIFLVFPRSRAVCGSLASEKIFLQKFSSLSPSVTESDF